MPELYIIAGCNGAGKTTAAYSLLPDVLPVLEFVNADEIARGLSPFNPSGVSFQAGRIMLERIEVLMNERKNFAIETTLSGKLHLQTIERSKQAGYSVTLIFVYLNSKELAKERVSIRVKKGGHSINEDIIDRRYEKGIENLPTYIEMVNDWYLFDNSGRGYELIAKCVASTKNINNFDLYNKLIGK